MRSGLILVVALLALLPLSAAQPPPPSPGAGQAPLVQPPLAPPSERPVVEAEDVAAEVHDFYREYWKAWDDRDTVAIANDLTRDFISLAHTPQGVAQVDKPGAVAGIRNFFEVVRDKETIWTRSLLAVVPRSPTEAIAAVRNDFLLRDAGTETELTLEVLRKGADGRWRMLRKWSERRAF